MKGMTYNGVHSSSIEGLSYITSNPFIMPERKDQYVEIPFRDSSYLIPDASQKDIDIPVEFTLQAKDKAELFTRFVQVQDWLHSTKRELFSFDDIPNINFKGKVFGSVALQHVPEFDGIAEFTVTFRCEPKLYPVSEVIE